MNCFSRGYLQSFLDNEIPADDRAAILDHLDRCQHCQLQLEQISKNAVLIRDAIEKLTPETPLTPDFIPPHRQATNSNRKRVDILEFSKRRRTLRWLVAAPVGCALLFIFVYFGVGLGDKSIVDDGTMEWEALAPQTNPNAMFHNRQLVVVIENGETGERTALLTSAASGTEDASPANNQALPGLDSTDDTSVTNGG